MKKHTTLHFNFIGIALACMFHFWAAALQGQPIFPDPTFANNGVFNYTDGTTLEYCVDMAVQADGKVIWVGQTDYDEDEADHSRIVVMRLDANGTPDPSFGNNGRVYIDTPLSSDESSAVAIQGDGKILIAGESQVPWSVLPSTTLTGGTIYRLNANGTLDNSFGTNGRAYIDGEVSTFRNMLLLPDGRILASGRGFVDSRFSYMVARFNTNGKLDNTFNGKGYNEFRTSTSSLEEDNGAGFGLAIQSDGKILSCGYDERGYGNAIRLRTDGTLDPTFSSVGIKRWDFGRDVFFYAIAAQSNGKIVIAGSHDYSSTLNKAVLMRILPNGNTDTSMGSGSGYNLYGDAFGAAFSMGIQADGKYVLGGLDQLIRVNTNGTLDTSFDGDGFYDLPLNGNFIVASLNIILSGDKIYMAGYEVTTNSDYNGFIARIANNGISTDSEPEPLASVRLFPNPVRDLLTVTFEQPELAGDVLLEVFDATGRKVYSSIESLSNVAQVPVDDWPNGMYYLTITASGSGARRSWPVVVQH